MSKLYVVATPIGNLDDISLRAVETLKYVDVIAAEDTRHTRRLLNHLGISTRLEAYHDGNEVPAANRIVERILAGETVALVSDAGTPLISDPGFRLVSRALEANVEVIPIPGASSVITALSVSGLATDRFAFEGFLPARKGARQGALERLRFEPRTLVIFEAPHRIAETIADMASAFGPARRLTLARELTKKFEQIWCGTLAEAAERIGDEIPERGEFVIVIAGNTEDREILDAKKVMEVLLAEHPPRKAAELAGRITGKTKKSLYDLALTMKKNS